MSFQVELKCKEVVREEVNRVTRIRELESSAILEREAWQQLICEQKLE